MTLERPDVDMHVRPNPLKYHLHRSLCALVTILSDEPSSQGLLADHCSHLAWERQEGALAITSHGRRAGLGERR
jgi:hypothetical protein